MKNRAKCKLCNDIIESFHPNDVAICTCREISVMGGDSMFSSAKNYSNFLRVDDLGNEIAVKVISKDNAPEKLRRKDYLNSLEEAIKHLEDLPEEARFAQVNQFEVESYLRLIFLILTSED